MSRPAWLRALGRTAYHSVPPRVWRGIDGARRDIASLPLRMRDPERRTDPWEVIHHVGGDYRNIGRNNLKLLQDQGGLAPDDKVLDIGCGNGRMTWPLVTALGREGAYTGFDVSPAAIRYCRQRIGSLRPDFQFHHLDVRNGVYNPGGRIEEAQTRFPCKDASITLAFATSVFTHLPWSTIERYLVETRRVLAPGGRALITAFALTPQVRAWIAEGRTAIALKPYGPAAMTSDPHWPENAMAYEETDFRSAVAEAGLMLEALLPGQWRPEPQYGGGQDMLIIRREHLLS